MSHATFMNRFVPVTILVGAFAAFAAAPVTPLPDFRAKTLTGEVLTKSTFKGKPLLIQFWTTWCNFCRSDQPAVEQFIREKGKQIPVVCVSVEEPRATVAKYLSTAPRRCKVVLTEDTNLTAMFQPKGYPKYVLVDAKGNIANVQEGAGGIEALRETLADAGLK